MTNKQRANFIAWMHFVWILFGVISLPLLLIIRWWNQIVLAFVGLTVLSWMVFRGCWFTKLEDKWRKQDNPIELIEEETFVQYYLKGIFGLDCSRFALKIITYGYLALLAWISLTQIL